ncbi:cuticle protein 16.5-like [Condylostylus longicornis]|uniref:cuticle protein 16.5-like n=1 Tax=Condylostylus longicornis TaxID=2530218 RepID=UPI00244DC2EF|nr:cuticle protein 16.5-like [Condylostylus longicornis]
MFKYCIVVIAVIASTFAKPQILATSSQVVHRSFHGVAAPYVAARYVAAPYVAAAAPYVAAAAAPARIVASAPIVAASAPVVAAPAPVVAAPAPVVAAPAPVARYAVAPAIGTQFAYSSPYVNAASYVF